MDEPIHRKAVESSPEEPHRRGSRMNVSVLPFRMRTRCKVVGVHEHFRNIPGRKNSLGQSVIESISLGWFIHLDLDEGGIAFGYGPDRPPVDLGDTIELILEKVRPYAE